MMGADHKAHVIGSSLLKSAVEPTRSVSITVSWRRSASFARLARSPQASSSEAPAEIADRARRCCFQRANALHTRPVPS